MFRPISALAVGAVLVGPASAEFTTFPANPRTLQVQAVLPGLPPGTLYAEIASGDLDGNLDPDVVYQAGDDVVVCLNVSTSSSCFLLDHRSVNDFAILRNPDHDAVLVLADDVGVHVIEFTYRHQIPLVTWSETSMLSPALADLSSIGSANLDGVGGDDILGVSSNGQSLVALLSDPNTASGLVHFNLVSPQTLGTAWDAIRVDTNQDGIAEIAVVTSAGLEFFGINGQSLGFHAYPQAVGAIARLRTDTDEWVLWARPLSGGGTELAVVDPTSTFSTFSLPQHVVVAMDSGDLDADGDDDLALTSTNASELLILENLDGTFDLSGSRTFSNGATPTTANDARPLVADLDLDSQQDLAWADWSTGTLEFVFNNQSELHTDQVPEIDYLDLDAGTDVVWDFTATYHHWTIPLDVTHLQVRVWNQIPNATTGWAPPELVPIKPFATVFAPVVPFAQNSITFPLEGPAVTPALGENYVTYVEGRFLVKQGNTVVKKYPPARFALFQEDQTEIETYLRDLFSPMILTIGDIGNGDKDATGGYPPPPNPPTPKGP